MPLVQLTASKHLQPFAAFLVERGERVQPLLRKAGLPVSCLEDPKTLVPTAAIWCFRDLVAGRTGSANLTMSVMAPLRLSELGPVGRGLIGAPTLLRTIREFQRLSPTESSTAAIDLKPHRSGEVFFSTRLLLGQQQGRWLTELYLLAWMLKIVHLVDPTWSPREVWLAAHATPDRLRAMESITRRPRFNRRCTGFPVPVPMLALPQIARDSGGWRIETESQDPDSTAPSQSAAGAIKQVIRAYVSDRWLSLPEVCDAVGTSVRTMQRQLSTERKTYSEILEESRAEFAGSLLEETDLSLTEISNRLGYSNLSNFNRAFRRWAAVSPCAFRAQRRANGDHRPPLA